MKEKHNQGLKAFDKRVLVLSSQVTDIRNMLHFMRDLSLLGQTLWTQVSRYFAIEHLLLHNAILVLIL